MGLTLAEAESLGIGHLHPDHARTRPDDLPGQLVFDGFRAPVAKPGRRSPDGMNKTERDFAEMLTGRVLWAREPLRFRLAGRTWYTPDFAVWLEHEPIAMVEVKGFMRDDAAVKIKVAADLYPQFRWLLVMRDGKHRWDVREVTGRGIGTEPVSVPWIGGS